MSKDFIAGLVKIRDGVYNERNTNVSGYQVTKRTGTILDDAITNKDKIGERTKIRDRNLQTRKVSRIQSISRQQPTSKTKYVVLDSRAIDEISEMSNSQRRNFLSHLSDSDRRRVLRAIRVKDDLEDGQVKRRDLNRELEPQDLYVINDLLTKFAYSRKDDELRMLESYKDLLDETDGQEMAVLTLINKVIDGDLDLDADADVINDVCTFLEDNGFETESLEASLEAGFGGTLGTDDDIVEEESEDEGDLDLGEDEGLEEDLGGDEDNLDLDLEGGEEEDEEGESKLGLGDSAKPKQTLRERVADSRKIKDSSIDKDEIMEMLENIKGNRKSELVVYNANGEKYERIFYLGALNIGTRYVLNVYENGNIIEEKDYLDYQKNVNELCNRIYNDIKNVSGSIKQISDTKKKALKPFESVESNIIDDSYNLAMDVLNNKVINIMDSSNEIISKYVDMTGEEVRVKDCFNKAFTYSLSKISDNNVQQKVMDDIIDDIDESLGEENADAEGKTLLESLGSALEAFANGDNSELQALSELTIDDVQPEEDFDITNENNDEEEEGEEDEDNLEDEEENKPHKLDLNVKLGDSVKNLATALLNKDKKANEYIDQLKDSVDVLRKYNFKISDDEMMEEEEEYIQPEFDVVEPILTREEFQSTYDYPVYVGEMAKETNPCACINPTAVNYGETNPIIQVECNGVVQNWMPITGSNEKVVEELEKEGVDVAKTITDNCVPIEDYYVAAAKTNNLGLIDDKFYKRKLSDSGWVCDGIADCVAGCEGVAEGATFVQSGLTTMPKVVPSGSVLIYGTKYDYYNKMNK